MWSVTEFVEHVGLLLPESFSSHFEPDCFNAHQFVIDRAPLSAVLVEDFLQAFGEFRAAALSEDQKKLEQFYWTLEFLVVIGLKKNPHKTEYPEIVFEMLKRAFTASQEDWRTASALDAVLHELLANDNPVSRLIADEMCSNETWHVHAHGDEMYFTRHLRTWCKRLTPAHRDQWCPKPLTVERLALDLDLVQGPDGDIVPREFLEMFLDKENWDYVVVLSPLSMDTARLILKAFQLHHVYAFVERRPGHDPYFWAWDLLNDFTMVHEHTPCEDSLDEVPETGFAMATVDDLVTIMKAAVEVLEGDNATAGLFAAGFVEDTLQNRKDTWEAFAELVESDPRIADLLQGSWIPKAMTAQMPEVLRRNVCPV